MRENLLGRLRNGDPLSWQQLVQMTIAISIPVIMTKVTLVVMQYIDASMVGVIGAEAAASIGLVDSSTWLMGGLTLAIGTGFTVQLAQKIGANEQAAARSLMRHGLLGQKMTCTHLSMNLPVLGTTMCGLTYTTDTRLRLKSGYELAIIKLQVLQKILTTTIKWGYRSKVKFHSKRSSGVNTGGLLLYGFFYFDML